MEIAICEDDIQQAEQMGRYVKQHPKGLLPELYNNAEGLLADYKDGRRFDLIFLDILMDGKNGFEAAKEIRDSYPDAMPLFVFITSTYRYALDGYGIAWFYRVKPVSRKEIHRFIDLALDKLEPRIVFFDTKSGKTVVNLDDLIYLEASYGEVIIHTVRDKFISKMTLAEIAGLIPEKRILQVHRSYYVNPAYVKNYYATEIFLLNEERIPIGRGKKEAFVLAMADYIKTVS